MGVGYPLDIVICSGEDFFSPQASVFPSPRQSAIVVLAHAAALGADMYDSVYPTRTARFGVALVPSGVMKLKNLKYAEDFRYAPCRQAY